MTAYNIIQKHPEWLELMACGATPKKDIQRVAKRHIEEMEGKQNFSKLISDDIEELLKARYSILKSPLREEIENFDGIEFDGVIIKPDYSNIARKEHLAEVCAIFVKAIITELSGKAICTAAQVEEWRERYAVKLEGLKGKTTTAKAGNETRSLEPILYSRAKQIYKALIEYSLIDCEESDFTNLFCVAPGKHYDKAPNTIEWKGKVKRELAIFWEGICFFANCSRTEWEQLPLYINTDLQANKGDLKDAKKDRNTYFSHKIKRIFDNILEKENEENKNKEIDALAEAKADKKISELFKI